MEPVALVSRPTCVSLTILGYIQTLENDSPPHQLEDVHQAVATLIETTLGGNDWKEIPMLLPVTEHLRFEIPAPALTNQCHGQQFILRALGRWTGSFEETRKVIAFPPRSLSY